MNVSIDVLRDKIAGCWLGKNIGGTLGGPYEGRKELLRLSFYDPVPDKAAPNDDLDFQLVWLQMLEEKGLDIHFEELTEYWMRYLSAFPWMEYGFCMRNLLLGLRPPVSGGFNNYWVDEMGSPIRSEIWACLAPADPQRAASMAWKDACLDHAGGEGMYGEMFWAAVQSAAFIEKDPIVLIDIGLSMIPQHCAIHRATREVLWCWNHGVPWITSRQKVLVSFWVDSATAAPQNHAFTLLAWLHGRDFGYSMCLAVNAGYDTDCTCATLGALLGIIGGASAIPERWSAPLGEDLVPHRFTGPIKAPKTLSELTDRTLALTRAMARKCGRVDDGTTLYLEKDVRDRLWDNRMARDCLREDFQSDVRRFNDLRIVMHYAGEPTITRNRPREIEISVRQGDAEHDPQWPVEVTPPEGWVVDGAGRGNHGPRFILRAQKLEARNELIVNVKTPDGNIEARFVMLDRGRADYSESRSLVPRCQFCGGMRGTCGCEDARNSLEQESAPA